MRRALFLMFMLASSWTTIEAAVTFAPPVTLSTNGSHPSAMSLGDFTGDGRRDIAVAFRNGTQTIIENRNIGTPGPRILSHDSSPLNVDAGGGVVAFGDFDADGVDDWCFSNPATKQILILGGGSSHLSLLRTMPQSPLNIRVADLDLDGNLDLVIGYASTTASVMRGLGNGSFAAAVTVPVGGGPAIVLADVNGDGALDIVAGAVQGPRIYAASGGGAATFGSPHVILELPESAASVVEGVASRSTVAGQLPAIAVSVRDNATGRSRVYVLHPGDSGVGATPLQESSGHLHAMFADVDRDGSEDLVVADSATNRVTVFGGTSGGVGAVIGEFQLQAATLAAMVAGDVSGDGVPDVVIASDDGKITVLVNETAAPRRRVVRH